MKGILPFVRQPTVETIKRRGTDTPTSGQLPEPVQVRRARYTPGSGAGENDGCLRHWQFPLAAEPVEEVLRLKSEVPIPGGAFIASATWRLAKLSGTRYKDTTCLEHFFHPRVPLVSIQTRVLVSLGYPK